MPSPRAVLADIHDFNLDPKKAHSATDKVGRLRTPGHPEVKTDEIKNTPTQEHVEEVIVSAQVEVIVQKDADAVEIKSEADDKKEDLLAEDAAIQELEKEMTQELDSSKKSKKKVKQQKSDS